MPGLTVLPSQNKLPTRKNREVSTHMRERICTPMGEELWCTKSPQRPGNPAQAEKPLKVSHSDVKSKEKAEKKEMECLSPCFPFRKKGGRKKRKRKEK